MSKDTQQIERRNEIYDAIARDIPSEFDGVFASLTGKPTTIAGFGITDFNSLGDTRWQTLDATLTALGALTIAANSLSIGSGVDAFSQTTFAANTFPARASTGNLVAKTITNFGLSLVDDADATAGRATLGLGTLATQSGTFSGTSSGTNTGDQTSVSGNAGTATALQTARTINGVSFNGTANIDTSYVKGQAVFDGSGLIANARISGNVTGITYDGTGLYTITFSSLADYTVAFACDPSFNPTFKITAKSSTSLSFRITDAAVGDFDATGIMVTLFSRSDWTDFP